MTGDVLEALYQTTKRLETRWEGHIPDATHFHAYDPLPWAIFLEGLAVFAPQAKGRRFLDVGCGVGTKLAFMHYLGWEVAGIELRPHYAEAAAELCPAATITIANAFDVQRFDADVVSMYRPCVGEDAEVALERHVTARVAPGTLVHLGARIVPAYLGGEYLGADVWRF